MTDSNQGISIEDKNIFADKTEVLVRQKSNFLQRMVSIIFFGFSLLGVLVVFKDAFDQKQFYEAILFIPFSVILLALVWSSSLL